MSQNYTDVKPLGLCKVLGTDDAIYARYATGTYGILVQKVTAVVDVAGSETDTKIVVETDASTPVVLAELATGTSVAKTQFNATVSDSVAAVAAGTGIRVRLDSTGNDGTHAVYVQVWGSYPD